MTALPLRVYILQRSQYTLGASCCIKLQPSQNNIQEIYGEQYWNMLTFRRCACLDDENLALPFNHLRPITIVAGQLYSLLLLEAPISPHCRRFTETYVPTCPDFVSLITSFELKTPSANPPFTYPSVGLGAHCSGAQAHHASNTHFVSVHPTSVRQQFGCILTRFRCLSHLESSYHSCWPNTRFHISFQLFSWFAHPPHQLSW